MSLPVIVRFINIYVYYYFRSNFNPCIRWSAYRPCAVNTVWTHARTQRFRETLLEGRGKGNVKLLFKLSRPRLPVGLRARRDLKYCAGTLRSLSKRVPLVRGTGEGRAVDSSVAGNIMRAAVTNYLGNARGTTAATGGAYKNNKRCVREGSV